MTRLAPLLVILMLCSGAALAREKIGMGPVPSRGYVAGLAGKSYAVVKTKPPRPKIHTLVGAIFGAGLISDMVEGKAADAAGEFDPADILAYHLAPLFAHQTGMVAAQQPEPFLANANWKAVAAVPTDADYLFYVRTTLLAVDVRGHLLEGHAWSGVGLRFAVVERSSAKPVFVSDCYSDTSDAANLTSIDELSANEGRLYGDVIASLTWRCMQHIGAKLLPDPDAVPPPPAALADPLADYALANPQKVKK
jgi:hypothetical protein